MKKIGSKTRLALGAFGFFIVGSFFAALLLHTEIRQHTSAYAKQYQSKTLYSVFVEFLSTPFSALWEFVIGHPEVVTAVATIFIAAYTFFLVQATKALREMAKNQETTAKKHERAYIIAGGPVGWPKRKNSLTAIYAPKAADFKGPWRMSLHNYGRTPGFITRIEWGLCERKQFDDSVPIKKQIKNLTTTNVIHATNVIPPTGAAMLRDRHVQFDRQANVGKVFFGMIEYKDIFGDDHHSTFALVITENYSEPIGSSYPEDWS